MRNCDISRISLSKRTAKPEITDIKLHGRCKNTLHVLKKGSLGVKHISKKASEVFREIVCVSMGLVHNMQYKQQWSRPFQPCVRRPDSLHTPLANWRTEWQKHLHENHSTCFSSSAVMSNQIMCSVSDDEGQRTKICSKKALLYHSH